MIPLPLDAPISSLSAVGKKCAKKLAGIGLHTCRDLLWHIPARFEDFSQMVSIVDLVPGEAMTIQGKILLISNRRSFRRRMIVTEALVGDDTGSVKVMWFNQPFITKNLNIGDRVSLSGKTSDQLLGLQMVNPSYEKIKAGNEALHTGRLVPIYALTDGVSQKQLRNLMADALSRCGGSVEEWLPHELIETEDLPPILSALSSVHFPGSAEEFTHALYRFQFEELLLLQIMTARARAQLQMMTAMAIPMDPAVVKEAIDGLAFTLTEGQRAALWEIMQDLSRGVPMNRLLEGDVGSGKTVVAALAALHVIRAGGQVALMAPTELLARQHFATLCKLFAGNGVRIALCTSGHCATWGWKPAEDEKKSAKAPSKKKERDTLNTAIATGEIDLVIGTHALIQESVQWQSLALAIVDEQHRFGVGQRKALKEKTSSGLTPHLLSMTATPIPRSLALAIYGDLDISLLTEKPGGRKDIITKIAPESYRQWTYDFIRKQVAEGGAAFVICPLIDLSDKMEMKAASDEYERLSREVFPDLRVALVHGKMKSAERTATLEAMAGKDIDVLVATSVIEVGIDISHATVIVIEGAERFGLAQLHQFRGRVGRGDFQSYCFLMPQDSEKVDNARLQALVRSNDGFELAEEDLRLRGPGELYGLRQSGEFALKLADVTNVTLIKKTQTWARRYFDQLDDYPAMAERVRGIERVVHLE